MSESMISGELRVAAVNELSTLAELVKRQAAPRVVAIQREVAMDALQRWEARRARMGETTNE